jgi:cholesterol transport system auxiliary component
MSHQPFPMCHVHRPTTRPQAAREPPRGGAGLRVMPWLAMLTVLGACSGSLLPKPPPVPSRYTLDGAASGAPATATASTSTSTSGPAGAPRPPAAGASAPAVVVSVPRAAPGFDSLRMIYLRRPHELEAFAFHEWIAAPAQMLAPLIARSLLESGRFRAVLLAPSSGTGALRLETELIRLQQDFTAHPSHVRLTLRAVLLDSATRQVIAWREFDESMPAASDDPQGGAAAAHEVTRHVLAALAAFCAEQAVDR